MIAAVFGDGGLAWMAHCRPEQGRTVLPEQRKRGVAQEHAVHSNTGKPATEVPAAYAFARSGLQIGAQSGLGRPADATMTSKRMARHGPEQPILKTSDRVAGRVSLSRHACGHANLAGSAYASDN